MKKDISLITPVSRDLLYTKIADAISSYISGNCLKPGDKLPSERELAARFQTSRHSVREALRVLENQGIITSQMGSGTYVADVKNQTSIYLDFVKVNFIEMLNIKIVLEKYGIGEVIRQKEEQDLEGLERLICIMEERREEGIWESAIDKQFHYSLADLSGNKMLAQMIKKMIEAIDEYSSVLPQSVQFCLETVFWHRVMIDSIRKKNEAAAFRACDEINLIDQRLLRKAGN